MANARMVLVVLMGLVPAVALAHGPGEHPADPNLHVDTGLRDCSVIFSSALTQGAFHRFAREFGSVSAFKASLPTTLGKGGVALGIEQISFSVEDRSDAWNDTFAHPDSYHELGATQDFPKARLAVGVTDRIDIGAFYTVNPMANYGWIGLDVKYGLLQPTEANPTALALRGGYTKTLFVGDMDMHAVSTDITAGRTFRDMFTPYLGLGGDLVLARETTDAVDLRSESLVVPRALGGLQVRYRYVALGAEVHVGALTSYQVELTFLRTPR